MPARLHLTVSAGSRCNDIVVDDNESIRVSVTARPIEGRANAQLIKLLAERLHIRQSDITVARGAMGRHKVVVVERLTQLETLDRLRSLG